MKTAYITRYGAFGDHLHCSYFPRKLKEAGYDRVVFEYNCKGIPIYRNNPYIDEHVVYEPSIEPICYYPQSFINKRHAIMAEKYSAEHINLQNSIERGYIAMEDMNEYYRDSEFRRKAYGERNYYDQTAVFAGFPEFCGEKADLFFTNAEIETVERIMQERYAGKFVVIANLSGTSKHKLFYNAEEILKAFLSHHEDAVVITMGDKDVKDHLEFTGDRIVNRATAYPLRQSILMTKYANMTIGCESGLMVAATALGCPAVQLMTAASIKNHGGDFANDFSLQAPCECSPCHKGAYEYIGCPTFDHRGMKYPVCIKFDKQVVLNKMEEVYDCYRASKENTCDTLPSVR